MSKLYNLPQVSFNILRSGKRSSTKTLVENSRNLTLFAAQLAFVTLAGQHSNVSDDVCQFFGALIHLLYLCFFAWTGKLMVLLFFVLGPPP